MKQTIDELLEMPYWIIDIFPMQVPENSSGQFFRVEDYYLKKEKISGIKQKHIDLVLKLNCYRSISLDDEKKVNPPPERIAEEMQKRYICIRTGEAMIVSEPDNIGMTLYNPDGELLDLIRALAAGEGLFVWQPPAENDQK